jgi:hypothetical protein
MKSHRRAVSRHKRNKGEKIELGNDSLRFSGTQPEGEVDFRKEFRDEMERQVARSFLI